jgi:NAD(P)-dependent dehydrogenase (short-subunit alcohol dehydrogenase family)
MGERARRVGENEALFRSVNERIAVTAERFGSDDASFVTGVALPVDGGYLAGTRTGLSDLMGIG